MKITYKHRGGKEWLELQRAARTFRDELLRSLGIHRLVEWLAKRLPR